MKFNEHIYSLENDKQMSQSLCIVKSSSYKELTLNEDSLWNKLLHPDEHSASADFNLSIATKSGK